MGITLFKRYVALTSAKQISSGHDYSYSRYYPMRQVYLEVVAVLLPYPAER